MVRSSLLMKMGALALVVVGALTIRLAVASSVLTAPETRAAEAQAARWTGLAQAIAEQQARQERVLAADAARWTGLAKTYAEPAANRDRRLAADAARWTAQAEAYGQPTSPESIAHGWDAMAAHYTALAIQQYVETGNRDLLPKCVSARVLSLLPAIGDNSWKAEVASCGS